MCRYSVSLPPITLITPEADSTTAWSRETSAVWPAAGVDQRPQAGVRADHVGGVQRDAQRGVDHVEQEPDLPRRRLRHIGNRPGRLLVGQPQVDPPELLGHREDEPVELAGDRNRQRGSGIPEGLGVEDEVGAAAGTQLQRRVDLAGPYPGGVDDGARGDVERFTGELIGQLHRVAGGLRCRRVGQDPGPALRGGARDRGDQPGVVDQLPVIGQQPTVQTVAPNSRRHVDRALGRNTLRARQNRRRCAGGLAQHVAGQESGTHQSPFVRLIDGSSGTSCGMARTR